MQSYRDKTIVFLFVPDDDQQQKQHFHNLNLKLRVILTHVLSQAAEIQTLII